MSIKQRLIEEIKQEWKFQIHLLAKVGVAFFFLLGVAYWEPPLISKIALSNQPVWLSTLESLGIVILTMGTIIIGLMFDSDWWKNE